MIFFLTTTQDGNAGNHFLYNYIFKLERERLKLEFKSVGDAGSGGDDNDPFFYEDPIAFVIDVFLFIDQLDIVPDLDVFIDNGLFDKTVFSNAELDD